MQGARGSSNVLRSPLRTLKGFLIRIRRVKDSSATGSHLEMRWLYLIKSKIPSCSYKIDFPLPPFPLVEFLFAYVMFRLLTFFLQPQKTFSCSTCTQIRWGVWGGDDSMYVFWCPCETMGTLRNISRHLFSRRGCHQGFRESLPSFKQCLPYVTSKCWAFVAPFKSLIFAVP